MSTDTEANITADIHSPDFDGFINEPPYCYGWTTNANGVKVPVFPYVISVLGHLNLKKLGLQPEEEERSTQLMKNTLAVYLEQVIKRWQTKRHFGQKKPPELPLIILINIADKIGELITDVVEKLQEKYPFVRLIAVLPMPKDEFVQQLAEEGEDYEKIQAFETRYEEFKRDDTNDQKYIWELSEREIPDISWQTKSKIWRMFNEFVAQHSHLMIVFWQGKDDLEEDPDNSLSWVVRYKLEGYPGLSRNDQTDLITYPATGPVLHIQTDEQTLKSSQNHLPVYFYSDREIITKEVNGKRELIIPDPKFWDLEQLRHRWFNRKLADIGYRSEIDKNCKILKDLNFACQNKNIKLENKNLRFYIEKYVNTRYQNSKKPIDTRKIPDPDKPTGQLIAHYIILEQIVEYLQNKMYQLINLFCGAFLILLVFNALIIYLNDIYTMGYGKSIFDFRHSSTSQLNPDQKENVDGDFEVLSADMLELTLPQSLPDEKSNPLTETWTKNQSRILWIFWGSCIPILICILIIIYCLVSYMRDSWDYKYHQFKTLLECLRVKIFWKIAGLDYNVGVNIRSHQIPDMDWLLVALNGLGITIPNSLKNGPVPKTKERLKILDTIWLEAFILSFEKEFKINIAQKRWSKLGCATRITAMVIASFIPFLTVFFIVDIGSSSNFLWGIFGSPKSFYESIFIAILSTIGLWFLIGLSIFIKSKQNWLLEHLKWAQTRYSGFPSFLGDIYRIIKYKNNSKHYFLIPYRTRVFQICIILAVCCGAFVEINKSNLICAAVQTPSVEYLYTKAMAFRLVFQIFLSFMAIWWFHNRLCLFEKNRRRKEQLYNPLVLADYSVDMMLGKNEDTQNILHENARYSQEIHSVQTKDEDPKVKRCQQILLELGQEILAKRAEWLLEVSDRNLQSPK